MRIYKPRGLKTGQIILVTTLGVFSGIYIWKPLFEEHFPRRKNNHTTETNIALSTEEKDLASK